MDLVQGNPTEVKVVLATVATALAFHAVTGALLLGVLALKVVVIRWWHAAGRFLPVLGITVFVLLAATWASTAGAFLS